MVGRGVVGEADGRGSPPAAVGRRARPARARPAPGRRRAHGGDAHRRALLRSGVGVRAQARRDPLHRHRRGGEGAPGVAQRAQPGRALSGDRRGPGRAPVGPLRPGRRDRRLRGVPHQLRPAAAARRAPCRGLPLPLRPAAPGRPRHHAAAPARAQAPAGAHRRVRRSRPLHPPPQPATARRSFAARARPGGRGSSPSAPTRPTRTAARGTGSSSSARPSRSW